MARSVACTVAVAALLPLLVPLLVACGALVCAWEALRRRRTPAR